MENSQALAVKSNNNNGNSLSLANIQRQIAEFTPILKELVVNGKKLTDEQIAGRAMFAATYGLNPIDEVNTIVDNNGKTMAHSMHINGYRRKCQEQVGSSEIQLDFVEVPPETLKKFPGALVGYECRLRDGVTYTAWQKRVTEIGKSLRDATGGAVSVKDILEVAGQPPIFTGVGLVYQGELNDWKDRNFNPIERAKKRAEVNARHRRFPTNAPIFEGADTAPAIVNDDHIDGEYSEQQPTTRKSVSQMSQAEIMGDLYPNEPPATTTYTREDAERDIQQAESVEEPQEGDWKELVEDQQPATQSLPELRYQPDALKAYISKLAKEQQVNLSEKGRNVKVGLIAQTLEAALSMTENPKESRHQLLAWLIGKDSLKDADDPTVAVLYAWLKPAQDTSGEWIADAMAAREAVAALNAAQPKQDGLFN